MPYRVDKNQKDGKYYLFNLTKNTHSPIAFNTMEKAINQGKNWMRYRKEVPFVKGNFILKKYVSV